MDIVGFCILKSEVDTDPIMPAPQGWANKPIRVLEFDKYGGVLALDNSATAMGMFDKEHITHSFKCGILGDIICPPDLNEIDKMMYTGRIMSRKGGYDPVLKHIVIGASLHSGEFNDSMLWQKQ